VPWIYYGRQDWGDNNRDCMNYRNFCSVDNIYDKYHTIWSIVCWNLVLVQHSIMYCTSPVLVNFGVFHSMLTHSLRPPPKETKKGYWFCTLIYKLVHSIAMKKKQISMMLAALKENRLISLNRKIWREIYTISFWHL